MDGLQLLEDVGDGLGLGRETVYIDNINEAETNEIFTVREGESQVNILHLNIRSINKNFNEFLVMLEAMGKLRLDMIFLSETWNVVDENIFNIDGYDLIYSGGKYNQNDGMIVYIKKEYRYSCDIKKINDNTFILIKVGIHDNYWKCIGVYRPPSTDVKQFLLDLDSISNHNNDENVIYVGDINLNILLQDNITHEYLALMGSKGFSCCLDKPTRVTRDSSSCLDHFFFKASTKLNSVCESAILRTYITDHYTTILTIKFLDVKPKGKCQNENNNNTLIKKINIDKLKDTLKKETWKDLYCIQCPELITNTFLKTMKVYIDSCKYCIKINNKTKKKKPWITVGLINSIKHRDKLRKNLNFNNQLEINRYKAYRNLLTGLIKKTKENYYKRLLQKSNNDQKAIWNVFKEIVGVTTSSKKNIKLRSDGVVVTDATKIANIFNEHFTKTGVEMHKKITKHNQLTCSRFDTIERNPNSIYLCPVNKEEIMKEIGSLKNNCAAGPDKISSQIIKYCKEELSEPLVHLINSIFYSGVFPEQLKNSTVVPVYKDKMRDDCNNYRPISIISNIAKIAEKCIKSRLLSFLDKHKILNNQQFGFIQNKSTTDAIYEVLTSVTNSVNKDERTCAVFLDLAKAFDTVPHGRLLTKLERYGIRGQAYNLFSSYLRNRTQTVKIGEKYSIPRTVEIGIPQGTVLGPICFILYINDMFNLDINGHIVSYADDTVVIFRDHYKNNIKEIIERGLTQLKTWLEVNLLSLNIDKTKFIHFTLANTDSPIPLSIKTHNLYCRNKKNCCCGEISRVDNAKYLGIIIDENLKWKEHITYLNNKLRKILPKFYQIRNIANNEIKKSFYYGLVESNIGYGIIGWGSAYDNAMYPLEILQKALIKVLYLRNRCYASDQLFNETNLMTVRNIYYYSSLHFIHTHRHYYEAVKPNYNTRINLSRQFKLPKPNTTFYKRTINYLGLKTYNELPQEINSIVAVNKFKSKLRSHVLTHRSLFNRI